MNSMLPQRRPNQRPLFEFERNDLSSTHKPAGHRPDLSNLSIGRNSNNNNSNYFYSNHNKNRENSNTSTSLNFYERKPISNSSLPPVSSSDNNNIFSKNQQIAPKLCQTNRTLDTLFLVDLLNTTKFDEIKDINASSQNLADIDISSLKQLRSVVKADFSDNSLPLEPFAVLQNLEELDMSCNGLKKFEFDKCEKEYMDLDDDGRAWNSLHTLNLSHNMCSNMIPDLQLIPLLSNLNLSYNSISNLPSNLMYFTCLTNLDLSNNNLNSDSSLFSLATIPALQVLNLDYNGLVRIPRFQFGFEALIKISLKFNNFEESDDFDSLADILSLQEVNIIGNPIVVRGSKYLSEAKKIFANVSIELICDPPAQPLKSSIHGSVKTVPIDPLTLPFFTRAHKRALQEKPPTVRGSQKVPPLNLQPPAEGNDDGVFMTAFASKAEDGKSKAKAAKADGSEDMLQRIESKMAMNIQSNDFRIPPIPAFDDETIKKPSNFWSEIPCIKNDCREKLIKQVGGGTKEYARAFAELQNIVLHPELKCSVRENVAVDLQQSDEVEPENKNFFNNEEMVLKGQLNNDYYEGQEIDEIQDLIASRETEQLSRNGMKNKTGLRSRLGATPIPTARRSRKSTSNDETNTDFDLENHKMTREEINGIIQNMDNKLESVERDLQAADDERMAEKRRELREKLRRKSNRNTRSRSRSRNKSRNSAMSDDFNDADGDDGSKFARLNKQYESIRANLLKTLTE